MWKKILKNRYFLGAIFFILITSIIIFSWFRHGFLYGGGDVGLPSYDPKRILEITKSIWWEASAPGAVVPHGLTSVPFQFFQSFLQNMGFEFWMIQGLVFWILLFLMGYGMFLIGMQVFDRKKLHLSLLAGVFYMFNPYMEISVWHRFIHNTLFLAAALPFLFIFFKNWVKTGKYFYLLLFLLANFLAVYLYGTLAFIITIFTLLILICIEQSLFPWKNLDLLKITIFRGLVGIFVWLAINSWWLLPVLSISPAVLSSQHSVSGNISTLLGLSSQTIIPYSLLGVNPFYLYIQSDFSKIFDSYFFRFLPWLTLTLLIPGFMFALRMKKWAFWAIFAVLAIFLSKGATSPLGYPYIFGFNNFFFLGVLRNPFEKLGIFLAFTYAILIPIGIDWYLQNVQRRFLMLTKVILAIICFFILGVNLWPMWLGQIFGKYDKPAFVKVPPSYTQADNFIKSKSQTGRILHLPLTYSESISYKWQFGYSGVEPSQLLFKSLPSISHGFNLVTVDDALSALAYIFTVPNSEDKIINLLQALDVKFIILHKDIDWKGGYLIDPQKLEPILNNLSFLEKQAVFGDLIIYQVKDQYFKEKISLTNQTAYYLPSEKNIYWPWLLLSNSEEIISPINKQDQNKDLIFKSKQLIIAAENSFVFTPQFINKENLLGEMPAVKILPNSPAYSLIKLKEGIQKFFLSDNDRFDYTVTLAGKRLVEALLIQDQNSSKSLIPEINQYQKLLVDLKMRIKENNKRAELGKEIPPNYIFARHLAVLNLIKEKVNNQEKQAIDQTIDQLTSILKETGTIPFYNLVEDKDFTIRERLISRFNLPISSQYELLQETEDIQSIYPNNLDVNTFQINQIRKNLKGLRVDNFISYGNINLSQGINEINFSPIASQNLADFSNNKFRGDVNKGIDEVDITSSQHDLSYIDIDINPLKGGDDYQLNFQSWVKSGDGFRIQIIQNLDVTNQKNPTEVIPSYDNNFPKDSYENYWVNNNFKFYINQATSKATVRLIVDPWEGCKYFQVIKSNCRDKKISFLYEKPSRVAFKDIQIVKLLRNPLFLRLNTPTGLASLPAGNVEIIQRSPVLYSGKINLNSPAFLVFNESFHPEWQLELSQNNQSIKPKQRFLVNLYGNAWYIENAGSYNFKLEFISQRLVKVGILISLSSFTIILILSYLQLKKKKLIK